MEQTRPALQRWNEGLELARAIAVVLIVYAHGLKIFNREPAWEALNQATGLANFF